MIREQPIKRFGDWIKVKKQLHNSRREPAISEGDVWWCGCGENVGVEVNGKSRRFSRPVLVFHKFNKHSFLAIPLTTQIKVGSWFVKYRFHGKEVVANLAQIRTMSTSRLYSRIGKIDDSDVLMVAQSFHDLFCERKICPTQKSRGSAR